MKWISKNKILGNNNINNNNSNQEQGEAWAEEAAARRGWEWGKRGEEEKDGGKDKVKEEKRAVSPYFLPGSDLVLSP